MRQAIHRLALVVDAKDVPIAEVQDRSLPGPGGPLRVRLYVPASFAADRSAGLVYFHGGAGVFCSVETHDGLCRMLANEGGCRVVSVDYRRAPEHKFPAAVEDSCAAVRWVADHALDLRIDLERIAVCGDSSGGSLAAVVCQLAKQAGVPKIALQLLLCPVTDVGIETNSRRAYAEGYFLNRSTLEWALRQYSPPEADLEDPRLSPLRAVDLTGLPPAHIHTAEFDPLRDEGRAYAERLEQAGVKVRYTCHKGMIHHFYCMAEAIPYARIALKAAAAAMRDALSEAGC
jgi:acetyl esterase/lipase